MKLGKTAVSLLSRFKVHKQSQRSFFSDRGIIGEVSSHADRSFGEARNSLERILTQNIIPFWYPGIIDTSDGGYRLNHDVAGTWRGPSNKCLVTQARTLWFFSRLVNSKYATCEYLAAATHGYEFLRDKMWDQQFGGFYWEVDASGKSVGRLEKQTYGHAFALYALTEYATASDDSSAKGTANEVFGLLETKAYDQRYGGYRDILQRDWSILSASGAAHAPGRVPIKRMNTHLHLLEAMTTFYELTKDTLARKRLIELILVNSNSVVRKDIGACTDQHLENWQPLTGSDHQRISYGHDLENIWLLMEACKIAGLAENLLSDLYRTLFNYALQYGFDRKDGGFYDSGFFNARADRREKIWWVQAEGLVAALQMYKLTEEQLYWDCFSRTLDWIMKRQVDWKYGEWFEIVDDEGRASGLKAGSWKGPYHDGRAMLHSLELLGLCSAVAGSHSA
jgi:mannose/cellobiose epimerase-like protein (N-acyl-D-glucosamine 2-epimerase family)